MEILKYLANKKIYITIDIVVLLIGVYFVHKGISLSSTDITWSNICVSIGASLIAAGIVVFLDLWKNFSISKIFEKIQNIINEGGIEQLFKKRDIDRYDDLMNNLTESVDICGYSLGAFFDSFSDKLKEKFEQNPRIKIRVIFVECHSDASKKREEIEGKPLGSFENRFKTFVNFFNSCDNVEIRLIDSPLSSMIFRIDNVLFIGPHFYKKQSKATLTMELKKNKWMYDEYQKEFDRMWNDAKPI